MSNFSIPFVASLQNDPAIKDSEAYFNLGAFAFDNGSRLVYSTVQNSFPTFCAS